MIVTSLVSSCNPSTSKTFTQPVVWNKELLFVGGFLARAAYELEMQDIKIQWDASVASKKPGEPLNSEAHKRFYDEARHILRFFTFHISTPSALVSCHMKSAFFNCGFEGQPFPVISSAGVESAFDVRMSSSTFSAFLPGLPVFPEELLGDCEPMVATLQGKGMLKTITPADVFQELRKRPLSKEEMAACLQWWINKFRSSPDAACQTQRQQLLDAAVLTIGSPDNGDKREIPLKAIKTFLNPKNAVDIPLDGPLPGHLLPISVNQELNSDQLQMSLQWRELTILEWVQHIVDPVVYTRRSEFNIVESPVWADRVLRVLGERWPALSRANRASAVVRLLDKLACIPTSTGMKKPKEAYFSNANIFHHLPVVDFPSGVQVEGNLEEMLADLGVRKHVDLQLILDR